LATPVDGFLKRPPTGVKPVAAVANLIICSGTYADMIVGITETCAGHVRTEV
jgi:hypothetical protein